MEGGVSLPKEVTKADIMKLHLTAHNAPTPFIPASTAIVRSRNQAIALEVEGGGSTVLLHFMTEHNEVKAAIAEVERSIEELGRLIDELEEEIRDCLDLDMKKLLVDEEGMLRDQELLLPVQRSSAMEIPQQSDWSGAMNADDFPGWDSTGDEACPADLLALSRRSSRCDSRGVSTTE